MPAADKSSLRCDLDTVRWFRRTSHTPSDATTRQQSPGTSRCSRTDGVQMTPKSDSIECPSARVMLS